MPARKRGFEEVEPPGQPEIAPILKKLRNMWEFANLMQYIFIFGDTLKIDKDFDIEDLEVECIRPESSEKLAEIGLCLLKNVSSHRGLTAENFDEYTRRQYQARKPAKNPFGEEEVAISFRDLDIIQKIKVLVDLSQWTLINANSIKEKMEMSERDQANEWRIEPCGWDKEERIYFVLDDNRLYRQTDPTLKEPTPEPKPAKTKAKGRAGRPKGNSKAKVKPQATPSRGTRASKRLKLDLEEEEEEDSWKQVEEVDNDEDEQVDPSEESKLEDGTPLAVDADNGIKWECVAVTHQDYNEFLASIRQSRDANEKLLHKFIASEVMPIIEAQEEKRKQKALRRQREFEALQKLASAKRSSRIAGRRQQEEEEAEARAADEKRQRDLAAAQAMMRREQDMEQDREHRRLTREQRIKERELRRILEEEALNRLTSAEAVSESDADGRKSKRHLKAEIERKRKAVEELQQEEDWFFDCSGCGVHGANLDDGSHSVACDKCSVWQHSKCLGITEVEAEAPNFSLVCKDCRRKEEEASRPKPPPIKLKLNPSSSSPPSAKKVRREQNGATGTPKRPRSKKGADTSTTTNGSTEWHNTFGYLQTSPYAAPPSGFIAFKPGKYYIDQTGSILPEASTPALPGFTPNNLPRAPGQPPIGKFVNHPPKANNTVPPGSTEEGPTSGQSGNPPVVKPQSTYQDDQYPRTKAQPEHSQPPNLPYPFQGVSSQSLEISNPNKSPSQPTKLINPPQQSSAEQPAPVTAIIPRVGSMSNGSN